MKTHHLGGDGSVARNAEYLCNTIMASEVSGKRSKHGTGGLISSNPKMLKTEEQNA